MKHKNNGSSTSICLYHSECSFVTGESTLFSLIFFFTANSKYNIYYSNKLRNSEEIIFYYACLCVVSRDTEDAGWKLALECLTARRNYVEPASSSRAQWQYWKTSSSSSIILVSCRKYTVGHRPPLEPEFQMDILINIIINRKSSTIEQKSPTTGQRFVFRFKNVKKKY